MKANEAPEKIYLQENTTTDCYDEFWPEWFEARLKDTDIEYIRKDVVAKKLLQMLNISSDNQHFFEQLDDYIDELENKK